MVMIETRGPAVWASFDMHVFDHCNANSKQIGLIHTDFCNRITGGQYVSMGCEIYNGGFQLLISWYSMASVDQGTVNQLATLEADWDIDPCGTFPGVIPMIALDNWMVGKSRSSDTRKNLQQLVLFPEYSFDAKFHKPCPNDAAQLRKTFSDMCRQIGCRFRNIYGWNPIAHVSSDFDKYLDPASLPLREAPLYGVSASENDQLEAFLIHTAMAYYLAEGPTSISVANNDPDLMRCAWILDNALATVSVTPISAIAQSSSATQSSQNASPEDEDDLDQDVLDVAAGDLDGDAEAV